MSKLYTRDEVRGLVRAQLDRLEAAKGAFMAQVMSAQEYLQDIANLQMSPGPDHARRDWRDYVQCDGEADERWVMDVADTARDAARSLDELDAETLDQVGAVIDNLRGLLTGATDDEPDGGAAEAVAQ